MSIPDKSRKLELKSASDFEQWLNEINLFAQEMHAELHEIGGLLSVALASGYMPAAGQNAALPAPTDTVKSSTPTISTASFSNETLSDPLVALRKRLAQQLRASKAALDSSADQRRGFDNNPSAP